MKTLLSVIDSLYKHRLGKQPSLILFREGQRTLEDLLQVKIRVRAVDVELYIRDHRIHLDGNQVEIHEIPANVLFAHQGAVCNYRRGDPPGLYEPVNLGEHFV